MLLDIKIFILKCIMFFVKLVLRFLPIRTPIITYGPGSSEQLCEMIYHADVKKLLIITDSVIVSIGLIEGIKECLSKHNIEYAIYSDVVPDPTFKVLDDGLSFFRQSKCDAILSVGGGSSIDAAKVIALAANNRKTPIELTGYTKANKPSVPLYIIPTTAGTGSEVTGLAVISDSVSHQKCTIADPKVIPLAVALDPLLMTGIPATITAETGMDALTHAIESYISTAATVESDQHSIAAIRMIFKYLPQAYKDGGNVDARGAMALASCYAGFSFRRTLVGYVHAIAHQFGGMYGTPHGLANSIVLPYVLEFSRDSISTRLASLAVILEFGDATESDSALTQKFIDKVHDLKEQLGIPNQLESLAQQDIPLIADAALKEARFQYAVPKYMSKEQCEALISKMLMDTQPSLNHT
ncbi:MAG TPA: iron-containing alcohol dehydrogenase [Porticoccus sp.]|nr:iron-containing alcohol dehydrogenase [Porticoccus sp.]